MKIKRIKLLIKDEKYVKCYLKLTNNYLFLNMKI